MELARYLVLGVTDLGIPRAANRLKLPTSPIAADGVIQACYGHGSHSGSSETDGRWSEAPSAKSRSRHASIDLDLDKAENAALYLLTRGGSAAGSVTFEEGSSAKAGIRVTVDYDPRIYDFRSRCGRCACSSVAPSEAWGSTSLITSAGVTP